MKLTDFIKMQNKEMVESANIDFKLLLPKSLGGECFVYCCEDDTIDDLCNWVEKQNINIDISSQFVEIHIEETGKDNEEKSVYTYVLKHKDYETEGAILKP